MDAIASFVIKFRKKILIVFTVLALISAVLIPLVSVNYNMVDYLPAGAQSTKALEIMEEEFSGNIPNTSVLVHNVSLPQSLEYKKQLMDIQGVEDVIWLDDIADIRQPLETMDSSTVEGYYKNGHALFSVTVREGMEAETVGKIRELIGENNAVTGQAADSADMQHATSKEVGRAIAILLPAIIIILLLSTTSWLEPLLFLITIGIAVLINMGTNIFFGEVSFITNSISPILQLAVSLDYAIFMLHSFSAYRDKYDDVECAMRHAIRSSMSTIIASAATTLFGFIALTFMKFGIGMDLGINLAKGIVFSFLSCVIFLPALMLSVYKLLDRVKHRSFLPSFKNVNAILSKLMLPATLFVIIAIVPSFLGQKHTEFMYGNGNTDPNTINGHNRIVVIEEFGETTSMVLLLPTEDMAIETALCKEIESHKQVNSVMSYTNTVGNVIPKDIIDEDVSNQFYSDNYTRIIINVATPDEGELAFQTVEEITEITKKHYGEDIYSMGQSANLFDMKNIVQKDNKIVSLIAIISIFAVLVITFKSGSLPLLLLLTIETGIWINLAIPYFTGTPINFLGYLVINTVQLGATIDYAILLTTTYMGNRKSMPKKQAMDVTMASAFPSILVSASTLAIAGFTLYLTTSTTAVADIGLLLGRGTILSAMMVLCFLPAMLKIFDKIIAKTTHKAEFYVESKQVKEI